MESTNINMEKIKRSEIANTFQEALGSSLEKLKISSPSKKTEKVLTKISKEFSGQLMKEIKKQEKKVAKAAKKTKKEITA